MLQKLRTLPRDPSSLRALARRLLVERYGGLPTYVLLGQLFLAAGWKRAAVAHGMDPVWWNGTDILHFRADNAETSIEWYRATMLDGPVAGWPIAIGVVVLAAELAVAALLALNIRPLLALAVGAGLNVNFVLAGAVDPSVFYLVIAAAIALWHVETTVGAAACRRVTVVSTLVGAVALGALVPEITSLDPAHVIDDPAMVLCFVVVLWVGALWVNLGRRSLPIMAPIVATVGGHPTATARPLPRPAVPGRPSAPSTARCRRARTAVGVG